MASTQRTTSPGLTVVVPVKRLACAKSRLDLPPQQRRQVAVELAARTVRTLLHSPSVTRVLVVTADPTVATVVAGLGADVRREPRRPGLNRAVRAGWRAARRRSPRHDLAVVVSDLPDLTVADVEVAVAELRRTGEALVVVDHEGTGTTALLRTGRRRLPARFGPGSAVRHLEAGYRPASAALPGLRHDLDSLESRGYEAVARALHLFDRSTERQEPWVPHT